MARTSGFRAALVAAITIITMSISGCGVAMPADPDGTLDRVTGGELRVGATPNGDRVTIERSDDPGGADVELVEAFAASIDAEIAWQVGSEEALVRNLESGRLDLVVGGITDETPWIDKAGVTRPFTEVTDSQGTTHRLVMLTPMGENAFIGALERFLTEHGDAR
jgi:ABC-type amino acid transport substrate-binding protein